MKTRKKCNANYIISGLEMLEQHEAYFNFLTPFHIFLCFEKSRGLVLSDEYFEDII